ncbi:uncharacterized protein BDR25DRAFT_301817 [Lindgomyces ingoldianus]|uniref:Uncharacterized protein n=1 Tax=Lindgomyces ingoldianus TaxID=673940 RepID=A0ACB6R5M1_9PLEO|nr:uncharacterized protein BDR25DRAFT_301817 [Lindgomyces ingoldianus]KAF2473600.1 hypothetical protein BDR25DRAFT_301817 [Lindgomyces ingoldianus]
MTQRSPKRTLDEYLEDYERSMKRRGIFTRDKPSYLYADILWLVVAFITTFIFAGWILERRRNRFPIYLRSNEHDYSKIDAEALVLFLAEHLDIVEKGIRIGNQQIHFLNGVVGWLPHFISRPSTATVLVGWFCFCGFWYRMSVQHMLWRYNLWFLVTDSFVFFLVLSFTNADFWIAMLASFWAYVLFGACSVALHRQLGDHAWKPVFLILKHYPKATRRDQRGEIERDDVEEEDAEALLNEHSLNRVEDTQSMISRLRQFWRQLQWSRYQPVPATESSPSIFGLRNLTERPSQPPPYQPCSTLVNERL